MDKTNKSFIAQASSKSNVDSLPKISASNLTQKKSSQSNVNDRQNPLGPQRSSRNVLMRVIHDKTSRFTMTPQDIYRLRSKASNSGAALPDIGAKPPTEGPRNKGIQAIVSPPIKSKTSSGDRTDFLDAMVEFLKTNSLASKDKLYRSAKKLMFRLVASDIKAAETLARTGKDRDLMQYFLNKMQESGLDISPSAWDHVKDCLMGDRFSFNFKKSLNLRSTVDETSARLATRDEDSEESEEDENNAHLSEVTSGMASRENIKKHNIDTNKSHKDYTEPTSRNEKTDGENSDSSSSSSSGSLRNYPAMTPNTTAKSSQRNSKISQFEKIKTKLNQLESSYYRSGSETSIADRVREIRDRLESRIFTKEEEANDEDIVIWDDEEMSIGDDTNEISKLVQDIQDVFHDGAEFWNDYHEPVMYDFQGDSSPDWTLSDEHFDLTSSGGNNIYDGDEREEFFRSEFKDSITEETSRSDFIASVKSGLLPLDWGPEEYDVIEHVEVYFDDEGRETNRLEFNAEGKLSREVLVVNEEYDSFIGKYFNEDGEELKRVKLDETGKAVEIISSIEDARHSFDGNFENENITKRESLPAIIDQATKSAENLEVVKKTKKQPNKKSEHQVHTNSMPKSVKSMDFSKDEYLKWRQREKSSTAFGFGGTSNHSLKPQRSKTEHTNADNVPATTIILTPGVTEAVLNERILRRQADVLRKTRDSHLNKVSIASDESSSIPEEQTRKRSFKKESVDLPSLDSSLLLKAESEMDVIGIPITKLPSAHTHANRKPSLPSRKASFSSSVSLVKKESSTPSIKESLTSRQDSITSRKESTTTHGKESTPSGSAAPFARRGSVIPPKVKSSIDQNKDRDSYDRYAAKLKNNADKKQKRMISPSNIKETFNKEAPRIVSSATSREPLNAISTNALWNNSHIKPVDRDAVNTYLASHGVHDLLQFMLTNLVMKKPDNPIDFLIDMTGKLKKNLNITSAIVASRKRVR